MSRAQLDNSQTHESLFDKLERNKVIVIAVIVACAFGVRIYQLGAASFAEDETNKLFALRAYEEGDFTANAEHPMVMKLLCWASIRAAGVWNRSAGPPLGLPVSDEAALRLPNATFGALTTVPLTLMAIGLLGFRAGLLTALLWAFGLDAIWFNRIAKEDTLLVFFMFTGFWLYSCAKARPAEDIAGQERLYAFAGAAFGLMISSKYFPHYFGLNALFYHLAGRDARNNRPLTRQMQMKLFAAMLLAFTVFNPAALFPQTWRYVWKYVNEDLLTHHGYVIMGHLFPNNMSLTPGGAPWYFYYLFLAAKLPLPVLIAFVVGLVQIFRARGRYPEARGYLFLRVMLVFWLFPMAIIGGKFLRYTLSLMPLIYMTAAVGIVAIWTATEGAWDSLRAARFGRVLAAAAVAGVFVLLPTITALANLPNPGLFVNPLGGGKVGYYFPHDEFYDLGARESIKYVADTAPSGTALASEIPGVVQYYLERYNRPDIRIEILSRPEFSLTEGIPKFILLQRGRLYFENERNFELVKERFPMEHASVFSGVAATELYRLGRPDSFLTTQATEQKDN